MIYAIGDIHGNMRTLSMFSLMKVNKNDVVIVLGDFGRIWQDTESDEERFWLNWLNDKPWTTVFVDGNHENFNALYNNYPVKEWNGGKVHEIRPSVLHLMRGEVFNIEGKKFFAFGGASSHDIQDGILDPNDYSKEGFNKIYKQWCDENKMFRVKNVSWWEQELPSEEEMENGRRNLATHNWEVDYVISHCLPQSIAAIYSRGFYKSDIITDYLDKLMLENGLKFNKWYCGHYHDCETIYGKFIILFNNIERIA